MFIREREAKGEQARLRHLAEVNASKAQASEKNARTEAAKSQQIAQFLADMFHGIGPTVALGRDTRLLKEILDKAADRLGKELTNHPAVEIELRSNLAEAPRRNGKSRTIGSPGG